MQAVILAAGMGTRLKKLTENTPKCMVKINGVPLIERMLRMLDRKALTRIIVVVGHGKAILMDFIATLQLATPVEYVENPIYDKTNYIYSIYCAKTQIANDDILLIHGDLVFEASVLDDIVNSPDSCMKVSSTLPLPDKDFKAVIRNNQVEKIGVEFFTNAMEAQAFYKLKQEDWKIWLDKICEFCENGICSCYAEAAFNSVSSRCVIRALDMKNRICSEIDTPEDLASVEKQLQAIKHRIVYMCFATDMLHSAHIAIIQKAARLGRLIIGVLSDKAISSYRHYPLLPFAERKNIFENISGVYQVIEQKELSYAENLHKIRPDYVVHGDDWREGYQKPIRKEVISILSQYGGELIEFPYSRAEIYTELDKHYRTHLAMPDIRRSRLKKLLAAKGCISAIEAHNGITGLIAEKTSVLKNGRTYQFDAMWISSLCDSTAKGKPDIELVDMTSRFRTVDDIMDVTTKPIIFDGDTGGLTEHFVYTVKTLERMGVSMIIIEDKTGLKKNSLFGTEVHQLQDSITNFSAKIAAGKKAQRTKDFMICARIESLILERGVADAILRANAFTAAGADAIMIHSRKKTPDEVFDFVEKFRQGDRITPLVVVPTSFSEVTEAEFKARGVNVVIYANHLTRSGFPAMQETARCILRHQRAKEADKMCMSIKDIITLIPEE